MAMYSWEVMPPPAGLEKNLGERRLTGYAGTGQTWGHMHWCCIIMLVLSSPHGSGAYVNVADTRNLLG